MKHLIKDYQYSYWEGSSVTFTHCILSTEIGDFEKGDAVYQVELDVQDFILGYSRSVDVYITPTEEEDFTKSTELRYSISFPTIVIYNEQSRGITSE